MIFTRVGNTMFFYVDGVLQGSFAFNVNIQSTANMFI